MRHVARVLVLLGSAVVLLALSSSMAWARAPERSTFSFHHVNPDVGGDEPGAQHCDFPIVGEWDIQVQETDFFDQRTGDITRIVLVFRYEGTLSNPESGKSVPDNSLHVQWTISFAPDGSVSRVVNNESVDDPLRAIHAHVVYDAEENVLKDVGRDDLSYNRHPISIQPLCDALS